MSLSTNTLTLGSSQMTTLNLENTPDIKLNSKSKKYKENNMKKMISLFVAVLFIDS